MSDLLNEVRISRAKELIFSTNVMNDLEGRNLMFYAMLKNKNSQSLTDGLVTPNLSEFIHAVENLIIFENLYNLAKKDIENVLKKFEFNNNCIIIRYIGSQLWTARDLINKTCKSEEGEEDGIQEE